jgi:hypothetical protein
MNMNITVIAPFCSNTITTSNPAKDSYAYFNNSNGVLTETFVSNCLSVFFTSFAFFTLFGAMYCIENITKYVLKYYGYTDLDKNKVPKGHHARQTYILTIIISTVLSIMAVLNFNPNLTCDEIKLFDIQSVILPLFTACAYFAYDILFHHLPADFAFHHVLGFIATFITFYSGRNYVAFYASVCLIIEISTIVLGFVRIATGKWKIYSSLLFTLLFILTRPIYLLFVIKNLFDCFEYDIVYISVIALFIALYILNMYWFSAICQKLYSGIIRKENL